MIALDDLDQGLDELHRAHALGLVGAMIAAVPAGALPYHDARYDPFWSAAARLQMPVSLHVATPRRLEANRTATETFLGYQVVQHMIIGMIFGGALDRHPDLQLVSVENDAGWAADP